MPGCFVVGHHDSTLTECIAKLVDQGFLIFTDLNGLGEIDGVRVVSSVSDPRIRFEEASGLIVDESSVSIVLMNIDYPGRPDIKKINFLR